MKKTTKKQLREATDSFFHRLSWVTGGTREETLRQAPGAIEGLESLAAEIEKMVKNPSKLVIEDENLLSRAARVRPALDKYRSNYIGVCPFPPIVKIQELAALLSIASESLARLASRVNSGGWVGAENELAEIKSNLRNAL